MQHIADVAAVDTVLLQEIVPSCVCAPDLSVYQRNPMLINKNLHPFPKINQKQRLIKIAKDVKTVLFNMKLAFST